MKRLIVLLISFYSFSVSASSLVTGYPFTFCDHDVMGPHEDYYVEFMKDGTEFEAEMYLSPSKIPCGGDLIYSIGRTWSYEVSGGELASVLKEVVVLISHPRIIPFFNKHKFCDHSDWKVDSIVKCTGKNIFGYESLAGDRTIHQFKVSGNELHFIDDSWEKLILRKMGSPVVPFR